MGGKEKRRQERGRGYGDCQIRERGNNEEGDTGLNKMPSSNPRMVALAVSILKREINEEYR